MTVPTSSVTNVAGDAASVGVQAQVVHNVTVYKRPGDSPEEKYQAGVLYLDGGMRKEAREFIGAGFIEGQKTSEKLFHWILALLSDRNFRQFSDEDFSSFRHARGQIRMHTGDQSGEALKVIDHLLRSAECPGADTLLAMKELDGLDIAHRDKIVRHLGMYLKGSVEDQLWLRAMAQVEKEQQGNDREARAWMFFQANPAKPRVREPTPIRTTTAARIWVTAATVLGSATVGYIGWLLLASRDGLALLACLIGLCAGCTCFINGVEWRHRATRLWAKEHEYGQSEPRTRPPPGGFADKVDKLFSRYFSKYMPRDADPRAWRTATRGIRRHLRDEIVEVYRETRITAEEVAWLIRYRVGDVARRWRDGTLRDYHDQLRTPTTTKLLFGLGLVVLMPCSAWVIYGAVRANLSAAVIALLVLVAIGYLSITGWLRIMLEYRRFGADKAESGQRLTDSWAAFDRWQNRLEPRPTDFEMANWLDCDRKLLMHRTMEHYKLKSSQVIAKAFIEAPSSRERARVTNGPWRYSRYQLLIFLLTPDGVRQHIADVDFKKGTFHNRRRINYRFDAVAAVRVEETDDHRRTFELTLVNGDPIKVRVTETSTEETEQLLPGESSDVLSRLALDSTGLTNTLHVLEGVAAEGREWIKQEDKRRATRR
jgi:hypothetical protein